MTSTKGRTKVNRVVVPYKVKPETARLTGVPASIALAPGAAVLSLAAVSWVVALDRMDGMDMGVGTELRSFPFFVTAWVAMMGAMMLPGAHTTQAPLPAALP